ncbi:MAG: hypothetical protein V4617_07085 [Gemmatimonadota bacterium]
MTTTAFRVIVGLIVAIPGGVLLLWPLAGVCDVIGIPPCRSWALLHGAAPFAWAMLSAAVFMLTKRVIRSWQRRRFGVTADNSVVSVRTRSRQEP